MNAAAWFKYLSVMLASSLKFLGGPLTGLALGLHWLETGIFTACGMLLGAVAGTFLGNGIQQLLRRFRQRPSRRFSKASRAAVRIFRRFGIVGIALITPWVFMPIGGGLVAVAFRVPRPQIFLWMAVSALFWGLLISYLFHRLTFVQEYFAG